MNYGINAPGTFTGRIANRENIDKTSEGFAVKWNEAYPDDQVDFSEN